MPPTVFLLPGYLLGSIPFGLLLTRAAGLGDIRGIGSGNIGATNVLRTGNKALAAATLLLDAIKGAAAILIANWWGGHAAILWAGAGAVLGHAFPVWLGFKGGKGVATGFGVFLALAPIAALTSITVFVVVIAVTRYVSLGSILGSITLPLVLLWLERELFHPAALAISAAAALLIISRHHQNIRRLLTGTESRFGARKA